MTDKYTNYPEALKKRIAGVNKYFEDRAKEEERWAKLSPEEKEAEIQAAEAERVAALSPEELEAEKKKVPVDPDLANLPEETVESLKAKLAKAEHVLETLKGKYEKEPAEMQRQINFLTGQLELLQRELLATKEKPAEKPKPQKLSETLKEDIDELKKELAPEIVEKIVILEEKVLGLARQEAHQAISEVAIQFDGKLALTAKERFDKDLLDAYPDWGKMWKTPEFQAFLIEDDGLSGKDRYATIESAFQRLNSRIVLKAFDLFTGKKVAEAVVEHPANGGGDDKLKHRVSAPRSSSAGGPTFKKQTDAMTPQEAKQALVTLAANYSRGNFRGTKEQYDKEYARLHTIVKGTSTG